MKILIIIPAFNEKDNIVRTIDSLEEIGDLNPDILVVNDCSIDGTGILAEQTGKARVIHLSSNLGIGGAVQTGFIYAREKEYDVAVQFDGDGQHLSVEIPKIIAPLLSGEADVAIGTRFSRKHSGFRSTPTRRLGIRFFRFLTRLLIGQGISDPTSGFRAYNRACIAFMAVHYPVDFPEPEAVIILGRNGFRIREVFTRMRQRASGFSSIGGFKSIYYMAKVSLSMILSGLREKIRTS